MRLPLRACACNPPPTGCPWAKEGAPCFGLADAPTPLRKRTRLEDSGEREILFRGDKQSRADELGGLHAAARAAELRRYEPGVQAIYQGGGGEALDRSLRRHGSRNDSCGVVVDVIDNQPAWQYSRTCGGLGCGWGGGGGGIKGVD